MRKQFEKSQDKIPVKYYENTEKNTNMVLKKILYTVQKQYIYINIKYGTEKYEILC